ncbi:MAG: hypothetical protein RIS50_774 [Bacteroidota bacterium]
MRILSSLLFTLLFTQQPSLIAQKPAPISKGPEILFDHTLHNFGKVAESIKFASHRYPFTNTGNQTLFIQQVHTSCGCTTPDWTRDSIPPGGKGFIEARYETTNRIGEFKKSITVYSNAINAPLVHLDIEGEVLKEEIDPNAAPIPDMGQMSYSAPSITFNALYDNQIDSQTIRITNETPYTANFSPIDASRIPNFLTITAFPTTLEPNETGKFSVIIDGTKINHYGFSTVELPFTTDNPVALYNAMYVNYNRKQFFPKFNAKQLAKQPKLLTDKPEINFGKQVAGDILTGEITLKNTGQSTLVIHELAADCGCISLKFPSNKSNQYPRAKLTIPAGESATVKIFFETVLKKGNANYGIWIVSNDPTQPERNIPLRAVFDAKVIECQTCPK